MEEKITPGHVGYTALSAFLLGGLAGFAFYNGHHQFLNISGDTLAAWLQAVLSGAAILYTSHLWRRDKVFQRNRERNAALVADNRLAAKALAEIGLARTASTNLVGRAVAYSATPPSMPRAHLETFLFADYFRALLDAENEVNGCSVEVANLAHASVAWSRRILNLIDKELVPDPNNAAHVVASVPGVWDAIAAAGRALEESISVLDPLLKAKTSQKPWPEY